MSAANPSPYTIGTIANATIQMKNLGSLAGAIVVNIAINIVYIIMISAVATLCEAFSYGGIDNLTVPAITSILYYLVAVL